MTNYRTVAGVALVVLVALLWLPAVALVFSSFHFDVRPRILGGDLTLLAFRQALRSADVRAEIGHSLIIAVPAAAACSVAGWFVGYQLRREAAIDRLAVMAAFVPLLLPAHAVAWALAWAVKGVGVPRGPVAVAVAHFLVFLPIAILFHWMRAAQLARVPAIAVNLGARRSRIFLKLLWPHQRPVVLASTLVVVALSMTESTIAYYLSDIAKPFSVVVVQGLRGAFDPMRYAASVALFLGMTGLLFMGLWLQWRAIYLERD